MLRAERGISRRELSEALGVHYQTVGDLQGGVRSPSLHLALRIAAYFEVPVEVIFSTAPFPRLGSGAESARASAGSGRPKWAAMPSRSRARADSKRSSNSSAGPA